MDNYMWFLAVLLTSGQWFDEAGANCNPPDSPCTNCTSQPQLDSFPVTSYLTWTCSDGFIMEGDGNSVIWVCASNSTWLGDPPNCTEITCSSPPIPANGMINNDSTLATYKPGDSIQYSCASGYDLISNETFISCLPNGTWLYKEPFCKIDCGSNIFYEKGNTCLQVRNNDAIGWADAKASCEDDNGLLALVKDNDTHTFLRSKLTTSQKLWIGGKEERHWKWKNSTLSILRLFWNDGEPNNFNNEDENCIEMDTSPQAGWNDKNCSAKNGLICQYDTLVEDLGKANSHQIFYRGNRYKFLEEGLTWHEAEDKCVEENGFLVEVLDKSTWDFISNEAARLFDNEMKWWIGGYADTAATDRSWFWVDNTRILQSQWRDSEPSTSGEDCIEMWTSDDQKWNDESCSSKRHYVCQFGLPSCGDPGEPLHGSRTPSDTSTFLDGATIDYHCDPGYEVIGNTSAKCKLNGRWDSERPVCKAITCPNETPAVANVANLTVSSQTYRGVVTYTCSPGYFPDASPVSYCLADGQWSHPLFTCTVETSTQPADADQQPQVNAAAIAGGIAAVFVLVILLVLAVFLTRKRREPRSKTTQEISIENNYHIKDIKQPVLGTGVHNVALVGDTSGNGAQSSEGSRIIVYATETRGVGADMIENVLYEPNDSASVRGSRDGTPNVQLLGVAARFVVSDDDSTLKEGREGTSSKSIPPYAKVNKVQSQMVDNELYGKTIDGDLHHVPGAYDKGFKDPTNLQTVTNSAPSDGMIDNEVYVPSPDEARYYEIEKDGQEEDFHHDGSNNTLYTASDVTDRVGGQGSTAYENTEYHDVPDNLVDNELYKM